MAEEKEQTVVTIRLDAAVKAALERRAIQYGLSLDELAEALMKNAARRASDDAYQSLFGLDSPSPGLRGY